MAETKAINERFTAAFMLVLAIAVRCKADDRDKIEFFEKRIRPVLIQSCYRCHSKQADEIQAGLRLDSRKGILQGGDNGPAIIPGNPDKSLLIQAIRYESVQMPPKNKLPDEVVADFVAWVEAGAIDPRDTSDGSTNSDPWQVVLEARKDWWSLQPVVHEPPPLLADNQSASDIDRFIIEKLEKQNLQLANQADARTLIRRLFLVLTGLPASRSEIDRFVRAAERDFDSAYEQLVDRLLASQHFGERWARHWMDVVRFTETHGNEWNYEVHHAWRYRDYLIRAFNSDLPYDQFVKEHIAGDLLASPRMNRSLHINESIIGTAFYRFGEASHDDCVSLTAIGYDILDNQIDTLSKAFQATTIACARCHDHKIDVVSMDDYYALLGILKSSRPTAHTIDAPGVNAVAIQKLQSLKTKIEQELIRHWKAESSNIDALLLKAAAALAEQTLPKQTESQKPENDSDKRINAIISALKHGKDDISHPLWMWHKIDSSKDASLAWKAAEQELAETHEKHLRFNQDEFETIADFGDTNSLDDWTASGKAFSSPHNPKVELALQNQGEQLVQAVLPAGRYTHLLSQKLNGTLRSPALPTDRKYVSARVLGDHTSAYRLVSNNCQLNYNNYKALTFDQPRWVTFPIPNNAGQLSTFAELVTKYNNPKFPDQLGTLGGDRKNDRVPWKQAATDPHSYFGITHVVVHEQPHAPKPNLSAAMRLVQSDEKITSVRDVAVRYAHVIQSAMDAFSEESADETDAYWLDWATKNQLLDHTVSATPELQKLVLEYRNIESQIKRPRISAGIGDSVDGVDHRLLLRGNYATPGKRVARGYVQVLSKNTQFKNGSGRRELADLIASSDNPLTARVMVNRIWHHLFGTGLVKTVDDFGRVGELPSHPKLLDHLAFRFSNSENELGLNWSIKRLIREIVLTKTFRASNVPDVNAREVDPNNRLLQHYPVRRLESEAIRDSILMASGRLDRTMFGFSIDPYRKQANTTRRLFAGPLDGDGRRSLYIKTNLMEAPEFLSSFNLPGGKVAQGRRDITNVPAQALTLLNDQFVMQQADVWAAALVQQTNDQIESRLDQMFQKAVGRPASLQELTRFKSFISEVTKLRKIDDEDTLRNQPLWKDVAHVLFNTKEFIYIP